LWGGFGLEDFLYVGLFGLMGFFGLRPHGPWTSPVDWAKLTTLPIRKRKMMVQISKAHRWKQQSQKQTNKRPLTMVHKIKWHDKKPCQSLPRYTCKSFQGTTQLSKS